MQLQLNQDITQCIYIKYKKMIRGIGWLVLLDSVEVPKADKT